MYKNQKLLLDKVKWKDSTHVGLILIIVKIIIKMRIIIIIILMRIMRIKIILMRIKIISMRIEKICYCLVYLKMVILINLKLTIKYNSSDEKDQY